MNANRSAGTDAACPVVHRDGFMPDFSGAERALKAVLWFSGLTMVGEILAGWVFGSLALLADGWHMATHVAAMGIGALAYAYMRRRSADVRFSFGPGKVSYLTGFASSLMLAFVALAMLVEAAQRVFEPGQIRYDEAMVVAVFGLLVNLASAWMLHGRHLPHGTMAAGAEHSHDHDHDTEHGHPHGHDDHNLRAAYLHVVSDALTSVGAVAALAAGKWTGAAWLDPLIAAVAGVLILRWSYALARDSAGVLLDASVSAERLASVRRQVQGEGDVEVLDLHMWLIAPGRHALMLSVRAAPGLGAEAIRARLSGDHAPEHLTVEIHPGHGFVAMQQTL